MQAQAEQSSADELPAGTAAVPEGDGDDFDWVGASDDEPVASGDDDLAWPAGPGDEGWTEPPYNLALPPAPPLPPAPSTPADGRARRPVWPLLLAAGTLVAVLMVCGLLSAGWLGWQALSTQLALQPTGTPLVETDGTATPGGVVVIVATPTPNALEATATAEMATTATAQALFTVTPTPTELFGFETPTSEPPFLSRRRLRRPGHPSLSSRRRRRAIRRLSSRPIHHLSRRQRRQPRGRPARQQPFTGEAFSASFIANPLSIQFGQTSTLTWNVRGIKEMFLNGEAISGPTGSKVVQPTTTTTYVLRMIMRDNSVREETQTVTVSVPSPTATPTRRRRPQPLPFVNMSTPRT
jgi:hypothetical protein